MDKKIEDLSEKELVWKFLKELKMTLGNDSVFMKNKDGYFSVLNIGRIDLIRNREMLESILEQKEISVNIKQESDTFLVSCGNTKIYEKNINKAIILSYLIDKIKQN